MLLPPSDRDDLRGRKASADEVIRWFQFDHVVLHAHGGSDRWHNLTPMMVVPHRQKSRRDTSIAAKVKRLQNAPTVAAGKLKPMSKGKQQAAGRRTTGRLPKPWGRPGWRRKVNGEVVRV